MKNKIYLILLLFALLSSCEPELIDKGNSDPNFNQKITIKDGRLYFPTKEDLTNEFDKIKDSNDSVIYHHMTRYYSDDFLPLRPILTSDNEEVIAVQLAKRKELTNAYLRTRSSSSSARTLSDEDIIDHIDDLEDIIGDDAYASFLNSSAEVQVGDSIYKYTDVGLFIARDVEYSRLDTYLETRAISKDMLVPTPIDVQQQIIKEIPNGGITYLSDGITYFKAPIELEIQYSNSDKGIKSFARENSTQTIDDEINAYVARLSPCDGKRGLFGNLFGANKNCTDTYESRRRVKTKAFAYNFALVYHTGTSVKHQYKGWTGIWRQENTDVLAIGVVAAQFEYDFSAWLPKNAVIDQSIRLYSVKGYNETYKISVQNIGNGYYNVEVKKFTGNPYPFALFNDDLVIENWGNSNIIDLALAQANANLTAEKLNEYFWKILWDQANSQLKSLTRDFNYKVPANTTLLSKHPQFGKFLIQKTHKQIASNSSKVDKTFDWGFGAQVTLSASSGYSLQNASYKPSTPQKPKKFRVIMYGVGKRGTAWHGSRLEM